MVQLGWFNFPIMRIVKSLKKQAIPWDRWYVQNVRTMSSCTTKAIFGLWSSTHFADFQYFLGWVMLIWRIVLDFVGMEAPPNKKLYKKTNDHRSCERRETPVYEKWIEWTVKYCLTQRCARPFTLTAIYGKQKSILNVMTYRYII